MARTYRQEQVRRYPRGTDQVWLIEGKCPVFGLDVRERVNWLRS